MGIITLKGELLFDPTNVTKKHNDQAVWKRTAMVLIDDDTAAYYSWFINKRFNLRLNRPLRGTHLTVVNDAYDEEDWMIAKSIFGGTEIEFSFDPANIRTNAEHWWLAHVDSIDADDIREILKLGNPYFGYHITIGTVPKDAVLRHEHSNYIWRQILRFKL